MSFASFHILSVWKCITFLSQIIIGLNTQWAHLMQQNQFYCLKLSEARPDFTSVDFK